MFTVLIADCRFVSFPLIVPSFHKSCTSAVPRGTKFKIRLIPLGKQSNTKSNELNIHTKK